MAAFRSELKPTHGSGPRNFRQQLPNFRPARIFDIRCARAVETSSERIKEF